jgi:hypothetical protein
LAVVVVVVWVKVAGVFLGMFWRISSPELMLRVMTSAAWVRL